MRLVFINKDIKNRKLFKKYEKERRFYKIMQQNFYLQDKMRLHFSLKNSFSLHRNSSISRVENKCILTGRSRSIYRDFRLSRMQLRHLASFGLLMGVKKSSW